MSNSKKKKTEIKNTRTLILVNHLEIFFFLCTKVVIEKKKPKNETRHPSLLKTILWSAMRWIDCTYHSAYPDRRGRFAKTRLGYFRSGRVPANKTRADARCNNNTYNNIITLRSGRAPRRPTGFRGVAVVPCGLSVDPRVNLCELCR